eukprot:TRINITY_DN6009_c0_g1_i1.p1 TRINITY_DN6009_c0_g1~~TRINITY_DN6009_c0_g1_i1.p1  ORF type:complete len:119 (+),score=11.26 TRINITY_DN6009_c0_g1_i1:84-440(+)
MKASPEKRHSSRTFRLSLTSLGDNQISNSKTVSDPPLGRKTSRRNSQTSSDSPRRTFSLPALDIHGPKSPRWRLGEDKSRSKNDKYLLDEESKKNNAYIVDCIFDSKSWSMANRTQAW